MIEFKFSGNTKRTELWLKRMKDQEVFKMLDGIAKEGVDALSAATPRDSGTTAGSWGYQITRSGSSVTIAWTNTHKVGGTPLIILLQYGHGTGTGGYVAGRDIINPAIRPIFQKLSDRVRKAVSTI